LPIANLTRLPIADCRFEIATKKSGFQMVESQISQNLIYFNRQSAIGNRQLAIGNRQLEIGNSKDKQSDAQ
jgi:hypothetical protein